MEFQGILVILAIFVNYADFYVNIIMLTPETKPVREMDIYHDSPTSWAIPDIFHTRYCFCKFSCKFCSKGKFDLPIPVYCAILPLTLNFFRCFDIFPPPLPTNAAANPAIVTTRRLPPTPSY